MISVPCWFTDAQRRATLDAANIAGLKCLRLLSETAATALAWGLPKSMEFPDDAAPPKHVLFYDMGHSTSQACIVAFTKSKMTVVASAFDRNLGGRDFDNAMLDHFAAEWQTKTKLNIKENPKSQLRLITAIDKLKQQLSGYTTLTKLPINVECLQDDRDFSRFDHSLAFEIVSDYRCAPAMPVRVLICSFATASWTQIPGPRSPSLSSSGQLSRSRR